MIPSVKNRAEEVEQVCLRHGVERLDLFGSAAGDSLESEVRDLDFVVSFERRDPPELFDRYFALREDLEKLFRRQVDLVMEGAVEANAYFARSVAETRIPLYEA